MNKTKFEEWFQQQPFYLNLRFIHGDQLFTSENWEKDAEYADQIASEDCVQNTLNDCIEELRQVIKGDMNEQHINR